MPRGAEVDDSAVDAIRPEEGPGRILARGSRDLTVRRQRAMPSRSAAGPPDPVWISNSALLLGTCSAPLLGGGLCLLLI